MIIEANKKLIRGMATKNTDTYGHGSLWRRCTVLATYLRWEEVWLPSTGYRTFLTKWLHVLLQGFVSLVLCLWALLGCSGDRAIATSFWCPSSYEIRSFCSNSHWAWNWSRCCLDTLMKRPNLRDPIYLCHVFACGPCSATFETFSCCWEIQNRSTAHTIYYFVVVTKWDKVGRKEGNRGNTV